MNKFITRAANHVRNNTNIVISDDDFIKVLKQDSYVFESTVNNSLDWDVLESLILNTFSLHVMNRRWPTSDEFSAMSQSEFEAFNDTFINGCGQHGFVYSTEPL